MIREGPVQGRFFYEVQVVDARDGAVRTLPARQALALGKKSLGLLLHPEHLLHHGEHARVIGVKARRFKLVANALVQAGHLDFYQRVRLTIQGS